MAFGAATTCAEEDHRFSPRIANGGERLEKALAVGVLADELATAADDAIDRPHDGGRFAQAIEVLDHRYFVRQAAIESAKSHGLLPGGPRSRRSAG